MIVVSGTSPLTALLTVGEAELLIKLFQEVVIPEAVRNELLRNHPQLPNWLRVASVQATVQAGKYSQALLQRLEQETGMYLSGDIRNQALKTLGE